MTTDSLPPPAGRPSSAPSSAPGSGTDLTFIANHSKWSLGLFRPLHHPGVLPPIGRRVATDVGGHQDQPTSPVARGPSGGAEADLSLHRLGAGAVVLGSTSSLQVRAEQQ